MQFRWGILRWGGLEEDGLRKYLMKELQPLCEAEPPVLADYVIALLKNEAPLHEMQDICERELQDFLQEHTKPFVVRLFEALADRSFVPAGEVSADQSSEIPDDEGCDKPLLLSNTVAGVEPDKKDGKLSQTHISSSQRNQKRRAVSHSSDEEEQQGGHRSMRRRGRTPSPEPSNSKDRNIGNQFRQSMYSTGSMRQGFGNSFALMSAPGEAEEYNPEEPAVPELQQRQMRNVVPGMSGMPSVGQLQFQQGMHGMGVHGAGLLPNHMVGGGMRPKTLAEAQMLLRTQLQAQLHREMPNNLQASSMSTAAGMVAGMGIGMMGMGMRGPGVGMCGMGNNAAGRGIGRGGPVMGMNYNGGGGMMGLVNPMASGMHRSGMMGMEMGGRVDRPGNMRLGMGSNGSNAMGHGSSGGRVEGWDRGGATWVEGMPSRPSGDVWEDEGWGRGGHEGRGFRGNNGDGKASHRAEGGESKQPPLVEWKTVSDTVNVTNVPEDLCAERELLGHFSRFGRIKRISVDVRSNEQRNKSARITFASHTAAKAAISSVAAVMGNRFIQVKWAAPSEASFKAAKNRKHDGENEVAGSQEESPNAPDQSSTPSVSEAVQIKIKKPIEQPSQDAIIERQKQIINELREKTTPAERKAELKAEFKKLKEELAASLTAMHLMTRQQSDVTAHQRTESSESSPSHSKAQFFDGPDVRLDVLRMGTAVKRDRAAEAKAHRLDNRPRTLLLSDVHPDIRYAGLIKCHFETFGQVDDVVMDAGDQSLCRVVFRRRQDAETAMEARLLNGKALKISWYSPPAS